MNPFDFISKWFWAVCIVLSFVNAAIMKFRARPYIQANPELADGYSKIINGMLVWGDIPWVILGIGCVTGKVPSVFYLFRPRDGNPYVTAFYASALLIWILGTNWIVFRGGAEMFVKHPGVLNFNVKSPRTMILLWFLSVAGGIVGFLIVYFQNIPFPFPSS
jgi:hypothetical protein